jgi:hypothetical protein
MKKTALPRWRVGLPAYPCNPWFSGAEREAQPVIPALVQRQGINVRKVSPSTLLIVNLISPNGQYDDVFYYVLGWLGGGSR